MTDRVTDAELAEIARLYAVATTPLNDPDADQDARVDHSLARIRAEVKLEETDAIGGLLAELSATRRERDEAYRTADQLREGVPRLEEENRRLRTELDARNAEVEALMDRLADVAPSDEEVAQRAIVIRKHGDRATVTLECTPDNFIVLWRALPLAEAELCADSARSILGYVLADYVAQLRAEQAADRAAVRALVESLPRCDEPGCLAHATCGFASEEVVSAVRFCDAHREDGCVDRPEAEEIRALLDRMATWGEAAPAKAPREPEVSPRWAAALQQEAEAFARYKAPDAQRDAIILGRATKLVRSEREARLILEALGWDTDAAVERVLRDGGAVDREPAESAAQQDDDFVDVYASDHARDVQLIRQALESDADVSAAIDWPAFFLRRKRLGAAAESIEAPVRATVEWMVQEFGWEEAK